MSTFPGCSQALTVFGPDHLRVFLGRSGWRPQCAARSSGAQSAQAVGQRFSGSRMHHTRLTGSTGEEVSLFGIGRHQETDIVVLSSPLHRQSSIPKTPQTDGRPHRRPGGNRSHNQAPGCPECAFGWTHMVGVVVLPFVVEGILDQSSQGEFEAGRQSRWNSDVGRRLGGVAQGQGTQGVGQRGSTRRVWSIAATCCPACGREFPKPPLIRAHNNGSSFRPSRGKRNRWDHSSCPSPPPACRYAAALATASCWDS